MTYVFATSVFVYTRQVVAAVCNQFFDCENIFDPASILDLDQYELFEIGFLGIEYGIIKSFRQTDWNTYNCSE